MTQESALLVTVPAAERAVARRRARLDSSAADGVPAHITVLYPFLPPGQIDADVVSAGAGGEGREKPPASRPLPHRHGNEFCVG